MSAGQRASRVRRLLGVGLALCALWVALAGTDPASWVLGAPAVALALFAFAALPPSSADPPRLGALGRLIGFFLVETVRGAVDVGVRALAREPAVRARVVPWRTRLRTDAARLTFVHGVSLIPGTLTARIEGDALEVHVLDERSSWREGLAALETRIAAALEPQGSEIE